jgi:hypothetical protein
MSSILFLSPIETGESVCIKYLNELIEVMQLIRTYNIISSCIYTQLGIFDIFIFLHFFLYPHKIHMYRNNQSEGKIFVRPTK